MVHPRNPKNWCLKCNNTCKNSRSNLCNTCYSSQLADDYGQSHRISDFVQLQSRHRFQAVRNHAKRVMNSSNMKKVCCICGYDKHVEIAHLKPIHSFPKESLLSEVNDASNLMYLCPNCHWEQDNGLLKTSDG